jgi:protein Xni
MKLLLIDGLNLVRRIFAAIPGIADAEITETKQTQIIQSCVSSLRRALRTHQPSHCVAVFERRGETWRHRIFPDYKKNRSAVPELLTATLPGYTYPLCNQI